MSRKRSEQKKKQEKKGMLRKKKKSLRKTAIFFFFLFVNTKQQRKAWVAVDSVGYNGLQLLRKKNSGKNTILAAGLLIQ